MAKPQTKGPVVSYRLPLGLHRRLEERAEKAGMSLGRYTSRSMARELTGGAEVVPISNRRSEKAEATNGRPIACEHKDYAVVGGGLHRCKVCGRTRGMDGMWR